MIVLDGKFVDEKKYGICLKSPSARYGLMVFDAINLNYDSRTREYKIFRMDDHINRFLSSCKFLQMNAMQGLQEIKQDCIKLILKENPKKKMGIRLFAFYGNETDFLTTEKCSIAIYLLDVDKMYKKETSRLMISDYIKNSSSMLSPTIKCTAHYAYFRVAVKKALECGYDDVIFLNSNGFVTECSRSNIFVVKGNEVITPPISAGILRGITRDTVIKIAQREGILVEERNLTRIDLYEADGVFTAGTSLGINVIDEVDNNYYQKNKLIDSLNNKYNLCEQGEIDEYWTTSFNY